MKSPEAQAEYRSKLQVVPIDMAEHKFDFLHFDFFNHILMVFSSGLLILAAGQNSALSRDTYLVVAVIPIPSDQTTFPTVRNLWLLQRQRSVADEVKQK